MNITATALTAANRPFATSAVLSIRLGVRLSPIKPHIAAVPLAASAEQPIVISGKAAAAAIVMSAAVPAAFL